MSRISLRAKTEADVRLMINEELQLGDPLPSETALSEKFGVSRSTIREAIGGLVSDGIVERRWGIGTFVRHPEKRPLAIGITRIAPAWEMVEEAGRTAGITAFHLEQVTASTKLADRLEIATGDPVWTIWRTLTVDGTPALHLHEQIPVAVLPDQADVAALENVGHDLVSALEGVGTGLAMEGWLEAQVADRSISRILAVEPGHPLLQYHATVFDRRHRRLCLTEAYYRTELLTVRFSSP